MATAEAQLALPGEGQTTGGSNFFVDRDGTTYDPTHQEPQLPESWPRKTTKPLLLTDSEAAALTVALADDPTQKEIPTVPVGNGTDFQFSPQISPSEDTKNENSAPTELTSEQHAYILGRATSMLHHYEHRATSLLQDNEAAKDFRLNDVTRNVAHRVAAALKDYQNNQANNPELDQAFPITVAEVQAASAQIDTPETMHDEVWEYALHAGLAIAILNETQQLLDPEREGKGLSDEQRTQLSNDILRLDGYEDDEIEEMEETTRKEKIGEIIAAAIDDLKISKESLETYNDALHARDPQPAQIDESEEATVYGLKDGELVSLYGGDANLVRSMQKPDDLRRDDEMAHVLLDTDDATLTQLKEDFSEEPNFIEASTDTVAPVAEPEVTEVDMEGLRRSLDEAQVVLAEYHRRDTQPESPVAL